MRPSRNAVLLLLKSLQDHIVGWISRAHGMGKMLGGYGLKESNKFERSRWILADTKE